MGFSFDVKVACGQIKRVLERTDMRQRYSGVKYWHERIRQELPSVSYKGRYGYLAGDFSEKTKGVIFPFDDVYNWICNDILPLCVQVTDRYHNRIEEKPQKVIYGLNDIFIQTVEYPIEDMGFLKYLTYDKDVKEVVDLPEFKICYDIYLYARLSENDTETTFEYLAKLFFLYISLSTELAQMEGEMQILGDMEAKQADDTDIKPSGLPSNEKEPRGRCKTQEQREKEIAEARKTVKPYFEAAINDPAGFMRRDDDGEHYIWVDDKDNGGNTGLTYFLLRIYDVEIKKIHWPPLQAMFKKRYNFPQAKTQLKDTQYYKDVMNSPDVEKRPQWWINIDSIIYYTKHPLPDN